MPKKEILGLPAALFLCSLLLTGPLLACWLLPLPPLLPYLSPPNHNARYSSYPAPVVVFLTSGYDVCRVYKRSERSTVDSRVNENLFSLSPN